MLLFWCSRSVTSHPPVMGSLHRGSFAETPKSISVAEGNFWPEMERYAFVFAESGAGEWGGGAGEAKMSELVNYISVIFNL